MTKSPCYNGGQDCPRRYVGCKAECEAWHEWLAVHEAEREKIRGNKRNEADVFLHGWRRRMREWLNSADRRRRG